MKRKYKAVYILKLQGKEEGIDENIGSISKELEGGGATLEQIDRIGKKELAHENHDKQKHGYYLQVHFETAPDAIEKVRSKLSLNKEIMLQHYQLL
ncbi:30S ribosomal protein S6 [Verrucomicrobiales bacterium]|nr:30S ribosomal protein S6 [Verrucomicrobiales bacterium]